MTKIIEVNSCRKCPYFNTSSYKSFELCTYKNAGMDIDTFKRFPSWCPLPNKQEKGEK